MLDRLMRLRDVGRLKLRGAPVGTILGENAQGKGNHFEEFDAKSVAKAGFYLVAQSVCDGISAAPADFGKNNSED